MNKRIYKTWEDIYPLTLINLRFGGYVAFNAEEDASFVQEVNTEEVSYQLAEWLEKEVDPCPYGVGNTIMDAMNNLLEVMNKQQKVMNKEQQELFLIFVVIFSNLKKKLWQRYLEKTIKFQHLL